MKLRQRFDPTNTATTQDFPGKQTITTDIPEKPTTTTPGISESPSSNTVIPEKLLKSCLHGLTKRYGHNRNTSGNSRSDNIDMGSELLTFVALEASVDEIMDLENTSAGLLFVFFTQNTRPG